jgi:hypothetical protein
MFAVLLLGRCLSVCTIITGVTSRTKYSANNCALFTQSFFYHTHADDGGAIYFSASKYDLLVAQTTFLECYVTTLITNSHGGAIFHDGQGLTLSFCCFRSTMSDDWSTAVHFEGRTGARRFTDCAFVACTNPPTDTGTMATITDEDGSASEYHRLNFTACHLVPTPAWGDGFVLYFGGSSGSLLFSYAAVVNCSGSTGIKCSLTGTRPRIEFCNFYDNMRGQGEAWGVLYGDKVGFEVFSCIFRASGPEFNLDSAKSSLGFSVVQCVFSGRISTSSFYSETTDNVFNSMTASFWITHFESHYCPTDIPSCSQSPTASSSPFPSGTGAQTAAHPSDSPIPTPTETVSDTPVETASNSPSPTISQTSYCDIFEGATSRLISYSVFCVQVRSSLFANMGATYGGGICIWHTLPLVNVSDCTFYLCRASYGGGIDYSGSDLSVAGSCFRATSGLDSGTGISLSDGRGAVSLQSLTFVLCARDGDLAFGTIADSIGFTSSYRVLNFSHCSLSQTEGDGSVLAVSQADGNWTFSYCTVVNCVGLSGIWSRCESLCGVTYCNFYDNSVPAMSGVIACERIGVLVRWCVFKNNTHDIFLERLSDESRFQIMNCVFSGQLPDESYYLATVNNVFHSETATRYIDHLDTGYCPAAQVETQTVLPTPGPDNRSGGSKSAISPVLIGVIVGVVAVFAAVVIGIVICRRNRAESTGLVSDTPEPPVSEATPGLSDLGDGVAALTFLNPVTMMNADGIQPTLAE